MTKKQILTFCLCSLAAVVFATDTKERIKVTDYHAEGKKGEPLSIQSMPLNEFLMVMAQQAKLTYVSNPDLTGTVDGVFYDDDPVSMAAEAARVHGVQIRVVDGRLEAMSQKIEENSPKKTWIYKLRYLRVPGTKSESQASEIEKYFTEILGLNSKEETCKFSFKANTLVVHTTEAKIERLERILKAVDVERPQVMTTVDIYEVSNNPTKLLGMDWSSLSNQGVTLTIANSIASQLTSGFMPFIGSAAKYATVFQPDQVRVIMRAMETKGLARNLTRMVASGEEAESTKVVFARKEPIPQLSSNPTTGGLDIMGFQYQDIGDVLEIKSSHVLADDTVRVTLKPQISSSNSTRTFRSSGGTGGGLQADIPIIRTREAEMTVYSRVNRSLIIGGLKEQVEQDNSKRVPLLGWLLPYLFSVTDRSRADMDVAIVITPHLITVDQLKENEDALVRESEIRTKGEGKGRWFVGRGGWYDSTADDARKVDDYSKDVKKTKESAPAVEVLQGVESSKEPKKAY